MIGIIFIISIPILILWGITKLISGGSISASVLEKRIQALEQRVGALEGQKIQSDISPAHTSQQPQVAAVSSPESSYVTGTVSAPPLAEEPFSIESKLGGNVLTKVGVLALLIGVGFLFQYAYVNEWLGPTGWVMLGIFAGIVLLGLGEYFHSAYQTYAQTITGGGIGVLYLSIFAAFSLYHLIGSFSAFSLMILITACAAVLAIRYDALPLAIMGVVGGFLTPILISTGVNNPAGLFSYLIILNIGILAVSIFKGWRELNFAGLVGTFLIFFTWFSRFYTADQLFQTEFFITCFFIIFSLSTIVYLLFRTVPIISSDILMMTGVPAAYFLVSWALLDRDYHAYMGFFAAALSLWYFLLAYLGYQINRSDKNLVNSLGLVALIFITIAIPLQLEQSWITMVWALEAMVLLAVGLLASNYYMRGFSLVALTLAVVRLFSFELSIGNLPEYMIIFNKRFFIFIFVFTVMSAMGYLYKKFLSNKEEKDFQMGRVLFVTSHLLLFLILNIELLTFWDKETFFVQQQINERVKQETFIQHNNASLGRNFGYTPTYAPRDKTAFESIGNKRNISLSVLWALYGALALAAGIIFKSKYARVGAIGLFVLVMLKVFLVDMSTLSGFYRIASFIGLGVILITVGFIYQRFKNQILAFIK